MDESKINQVRYKVGRCLCGYRYLVVDQLPDVAGIRRELKKLAKSIHVNFHPAPFVKCPRCKIALDPPASQPEPLRIDTQSPERQQQRQQVCEAMSKVLE